MCWFVAARDPRFRQKTSGKTEIGDSKTFAVTSSGDPASLFFYHIMITRSNFNSKLGGAHRAPGPRRCPRSAAPCSTAVLCWSSPCVYLVAFSRASWYCRRRRRTSTTSTSPLCTSSKKRKQNNNSSNGLQTNEHRSSSSSSPHLKLPQLRNSKPSYSPPPSNTLLFNRGCS